MTMRLQHGVPHWLDNNSRERALAIMSFDDDGVVLGLLDHRVNTPYTLGIGDTLIVDGTTWRLAEIVQGDSVLLEEVS